MKLLFDQNLPRTLAARLVDQFPGSAHVRTLGLKTAADSRIWALALERDFAIVSKDSDFVQMSLSRGCPPKVISLALGNGPATEVLDVLIAKADAIQRFLQNERPCCLEIHRHRPISLVDE